MAHAISRRLSIPTLGAVLALAAPACATDGDFLGRGITSFDLGGTNADAVAAVAVDPEGRVIVAGTVATGNGSWRLALARFLPNGALDPAFGTGGKVVDPFSPGVNQNAVALRRLADGRLLVAGTLDSGTGDQDFYVGRLLENGSVDSGFGTFSGITNVPFDLGGDATDTLGAMAVDFGGRILLAGSVDVTASDIDLGVVRLTADGAPDVGFDGDGKQTFSISTVDLGLAIAPDTSGIVVCGAAWNPDLGGHFDLALARLNGDGSVDGNFGTLGSVTVPWALGGNNHDFCWGLGIWPDGEIVVAADVSTGSSQWMYLLSRFSPGGALNDSVLGSFCGSLSSPPCSGSVQDSPRALLLEGDEKIVVAGFGLNASGDSDFGVARWTRGLFPDPSFGGGDGAVTYDFAGYGGAQDNGTALALDRDGRIVVAGWTQWSGADTDFAWARFDSSYVFADGFEWPGGTSRWSATTP